MNGQEFEQEIQRQLAEFDEWALETAEVLRRLAACQEEEP